MYVMHIKASKELIHSLKTIRAIMFMKKWIDPKQIAESLDVDIVAIPKTTTTKKE